MLFLYLLTCMTQVNQANNFCLLANNVVKIHRQGSMDIGQIVRKMQYWWVRTEGDFHFRSVLSF